MHTCTCILDESDQSSDGGGSQGHSRETSVDRDQSREQSLERRLSQQSCSRASLIDGSHGKLLYQMSRVMGKPAFCICNKKM